MLKLKLSCTKSSVVEKKALDRAMSQNTENTATPTNGPICDMGWQEPILLDIAIKFSNGYLDVSRKMLARYLMNPPHPSSTLAWHMLLSVYSAMQEKKEYDKLAHQYSKQFSISPPSWRNLEDTQRSTHSKSTSLSIIGSVSEINQNETKSFLQAIRQHKKSVLDVSRLTLPDTCAQFKHECSQVNELFASIHKANVPLTIMGDTDLIETLCTIIQRKTWPRHVLKEAYSALFMLMQWQGNEKMYAELAHEYARLFEMSPLGYERGKRLAAFGRSSTALSSPEVIDSNVSSDLCRDMTEQLKNGKRTTWDLMGVQRVTYNSALDIAECIMLLGAPKESLRILHCSDIMRLLFQGTGATGHCLFLKNVCV